MTPRHVTVERWNPSVRAWMVQAACRYDGTRLIGQQLSAVPVDVQERCAADIAEALTTDRDEGRVSVGDTWRWSFE